MARSWLFRGLLLAAFAVLTLAQQAPDEPAEPEPQAALAQPAIEARLAQIETRLARLEQLSIRSTGSAGASSDRLTESRLRMLENAVMRLQQQR